MVYRVLRVSGGYRKDLERVLKGLDLVDILITT